VLRPPKKSAIISSCARLCEWWAVGRGVIGAQDGSESVVLSMVLVTWIGRPWVVWDGLAWLRLLVLSDEKRDIL
jgi:hypothetical protein